MRAKKPIADKNGLLRSRQWFDNPENPGMIAIYIERYLNILIDKAAWAKRRAALAAQRGLPCAKSQTPWQEIQRAMVEQFDTGMVLKPAVAFQDVAHVHPKLRDNHRNRFAQNGLC